MADAAKGIRVAAVGDLHCTVKSQGSFQALFAQIAQAADVMVLCGDLTDYGLPEEAQVLVKELSAAAKVPTVGVLGNHDYESGKQDEVRHILTEAGMTLLDGEAAEINGIGFAGVKGFAGGFGRGTLSAWGEPAIKIFVKEAQAEAMKLEAALQRLRTVHKIAVLHYSPIRGTVENEPVEIFPFLGCSRLEEPLNRYAVNAVVHGHAHNGSPEGKLTTGTPVYNVSIQLMRKHFPERPAFRLLNLPAVAERPVEQAPAHAGRDGPVETAVR